MGLDQARQVGDVVPSLEHGEQAAAAELAGEGAQPLAPTREAGQTRR